MMPFYVIWRIDGYPTCWREFENAGPGMGQYMQEVLASGAQGLTVGQEKPGFPCNLTLTGILQRRREEREKKQHPVKVGKFKVFSELVDEHRHDADCYVAGPDGIEEIASIYHDVESLNKEIDRLECLCDTKDEIIGQLQCIVAELKCKR